MKVPPRTLTPPPDVIDPGMKANAMTSSVASTSRFATLLALATAFASGCQASRAATTDLESPAQRIERRDPDAVELWYVDHPEGEISVAGELRADERTGMASIRSMQVAAAARGLDGIHGITCEEPLYASCKGEGFVYRTSRIPLGEPTASDLVGSRSPIASSDLIVHY